MTRRANARIAGFTFLFYIAIGITGLVLPNEAGTTGIHVLLALVTFATALTLAVSLYGFTRDEDRDLAVLALCFRVSESMFAAFAPILTLGIAWLGTTAASGQGVADPVAPAPLTELLSKVSGWNTTIASILFALGSTIFCYLLLRGRMIPIALAWLGLFASVLLVVVMPLNLAGYLPKNIAQYCWAPMALFEIPLGVWLLVSKRAPLPINHPL
jgi:hypothetical protein